jgi:hypothetical protein
MTLVQPETFTLTDQEAAAVQGAQMAQHVKVAGTTPVIKYGSIAVPFVIVGLIAAIDCIWWDWTMPLSLFVIMMLVFVAGMATQTIGYWLNLQASRKRIRARTRQVFEPRTVRVSDEGIEQALPQLRSIHAWSGIDRVEQPADIILVWAGNLLVSAIPARAFAAPQDARVFVDACRTRAGGRNTPRPD